MKRKCLCSLLVMMCFYCTAFGQWVVSDPALTQLSQITWAKELKQAYEQFQVLGESRDILTKSLYAPIDGHYVWKETRRRHWFGLTEAEISLVWLLGRGNYNEKKGGRQ